MPYRDPRITITDQSMQPMEDFWWPVSFRFNMSAPWGRTQQELTLDLGDLRDRADLTLAVAPVIWKATIAAAISSEVQLLWTDVMMWRGSLFPQLAIGSAPSGSKASGAGTRDNVPQFLMMTPDPHPRYSRRLFLPGAPGAWHDDGLLTRSGFEQMMELGRGLIMGFKPFFPDPAANWLIAYRGVLPDTLENPLGVAFKQVTHLRICQHTDRAPDNAGFVWP